MAIKEESTLSRTNDDTQLLWVRHSVLSLFDWHFCTKKKYIYIYIYVLPVHTQSLWINCGDALVYRCTQEQKTRFCSRRIVHPPQQPWPYRNIESGAMLIGNSFRKNHYHSSKKKCSKRSHIVILLKRLCYQFTIIFKYVGYFKVILNVNKKHFFFTVKNYV